MVYIETTLFNNGNISYENEVFLARFNSYEAARKFITEHKKIFGKKFMYWIEEDITYGKNNIILGLD